MTYYGKNRLSVSMHDVVLGRPGYMAGFDQDLATQEERVMARKRAAENFKAKYYSSSSSASTVSSAHQDAECDAEESSDDAEEEFQGPKIKAKKKQILTPVLSSTLDWAQLTTRKATGVVAATLASLGEDIKYYNLGRESLRLPRNFDRESVAGKLKESLQQGDGILSLHWDGVMVPDIDANEKVNRLPVHVVGIDDIGAEQLLGVPKVPRGDAKTESESIHQVLVDWNLVKPIRCFCFDTTNVNSGRHSGNCVRLEQLIDEDIIHFACRHHICELNLKCVYELCLGSTSSPTLELCQDFKEKWEKLDLNKFNPRKDDRIVMAVIQDDIENIIAFCEQQLTECHPRDDYRELLRVTLVFLGKKLADGKTLRKPGGTHDARWMVKAQYAILMYLYRRQFPLEDVRHEANLRKLCIFIVKFYIKQWYLSRIAALAPLNDLQFLQNLVSNPHAVIKPLCDAAVKKYSGHLWYLSEELVALALFDSRVPDEEKQKMVQALEDTVPDCEDPPNRISVDLKSIVGKSLSDFTTQTSRRLFQKLNLPDGFLQRVPKEWESLGDFQRARKIVSKLQVVNDVAERGVALLKEYNEILTKDEDQKQFLLMAVQHHRKLYPDVNKETLAKMTDF